MNHDEILPAPEPVEIKSEMTPTHSNALTFDNSDRAEEGSREQHLVLPPPDQGYAWVFLAAAFVVEAITFGYAVSVGVLHDYWVTNQFPGGGQASILSLAATLQTGLASGALPVASFVFSRRPQWRRPGQLLGVCVCATGIITTGFVKEPWQLILSLGVAYGLGGAFAFQPCGTLIFDWFDKKTGLAAGLLYSASGLGGTAFPFMTRAFLNKWGYKACMVISGLGYAVIGISVCLLIKPRTPIGHHSKSIASETPRFSLREVFGTWTFWSLSIAILTYSASIVVPNVYLPSFTTQIGLSTSIGTVSLALLNVSGAVGMIVIGFVSDRRPLPETMALAAGLASLGALLLWGFATNLPVVIVFSLFFGFFAWGFLCLPTKMSSVASRGDPETSIYVLSLFFFLIGVGESVAGPIASALLKTTWKSAKYAYGAPGYGPLIVYTGVMMLATAAFGLAIQARR